MPAKHLLAALAAFAALGLWTAPARAEIVVEQAWARATVPGSTVAAGYLTIRNTGPEARKLMRLTSPVTDSVVLHQSSIDAQGVARMWPLAKLELEPGEAVKFEPNGRHLMFMQLKAPFVVGQTIPVTFQFDAGSAPVTAMLEVRPLVDASPSPDAGAHHHH